jgi:hypothetical protein
VLTQRVTKTSLYLQMFEESINRKSKYSMAATEEFCMRPDMFLERWVTLCVIPVLGPLLLCLCCGWRGQNLFSRVNCGLKTKQVVVLRRM